MFNADKPIAIVKDDSLGRAFFSNQLATAILSYTESENFVVSLCGKWGSGKTSILNMVEIFINEKSQKYDDDNKPIIVHFNPWNYSDQSQLITQFFTAILAEMKVSSKSESLNKAGKALQEYSTIFEYAEYIPVAGKYFKPVKWIMEKTGKKLSDGNDNNLIKKRKEVTEALSKQSHKFIVIIDDIDRLNNYQIRQIFQLVNSLAGFPNLIYLLSFDRDVVVRALSEEQNCNGEEYLEKIIQVPFNIPEAKGELVQRVLFKKLESLWSGEMPCTDFEKEYWDIIFYFCISPFVKSIRDVNRIFNVYQFNYNLMHKKANCIDLLAITVLQIYEPKIYRWIYENIDNICGSMYTHGISGVEQKENYKRNLDDFREVTSNPERMMQVVQTLFPKFSWLTGGYYHSKDSDDELRKQQKIACRDCSLLYFNLLIDDVAVSKQIVLESVKDYDEKALLEYFENLKTKKDDAFLEYTKELQSYISDIPENRRILFLRLLIRELTIPSNHDAKGLLIPSPSFYISNCIWKILKEYSQEEALSIIKDLAGTPSVDDFSIVVDLVLQIDRSYGRIGNDIDCHYRVVSEDALIEIESLLINKLKVFSETNNLFDLTYFFTTYVFWFNIEKESLDKYINQGLETITNIPKYLKITANRWSSGKDSEWSFKQDSFDGYISNEKAYEAILSLKATKEFAEFDISLKKMAIAFCLWYEKRVENNDRVSESEVVNHLSEWENLA